jgi:hypothetical protein
MSSEHKELIDWTATDDGTVVLHTSDGLTHYARLVHYVNGQEQVEQQRAKVEFFEGLSPSGANLVHSDTLVVTMLQVVSEDADARRVASTEDRWRSLFMPTDDDETVAWCAAADLGYAVDPEMQARVLARCKDQAEESARRAAEGREES